jgi:hypothetical protein
MQAAIGGWERGTPRTYAPNFVDLVDSRAAASYTADGKQLLYSCTWGVYA